MVHDTYKTQSEADADRSQQLSLLEALGGWDRALRRDECNAWCISGRSGHILTWGDGQGWVLYVACCSPRQWSFVKKRMVSFTAVTQDGDMEGCLKLDRLPTPKEAAIIREVLGIRKRPSYDEETLAAKQASISAARSARKNGREAGVDNANQ